MSWTNCFVVFDSHQSLTPLQYMSVGIFPRSSPSPSTNKHPTKTEGTPFCLPLDRVLDGAHALIEQHERTTTEQHPIQRGIVDHSQHPVQQKNALRRGFFDIVGRGCLKRRILRNHSDPWRNEISVRGRLMNLNSACEQGIPWRDFTNASMSADINNHRKQYYFRNDPYISGPDE